MYFDSKKLDRDLYKMLFSAYSKEIMKIERKFRNRKTGFEK